MPRVLAIFLAFAPALTAQSLEPEQIARIFSDYQHTDTPGCAVGIDAPDHDIRTAAYGMADLEHTVTNTPASVFEAGSVSKQFTAAAVLLLAERGQLSLDDNIRKYFPEIPEYERAINVRELLNHTSGLRDWGEVEEVAGWSRGTREYTHAHVLDIISRQRALNYPPGDQWSYTNSGYNLSAMLVERVSGMSLQAFCRKEFFEPLGMASTQWRDDFRRIVPNRAIAYSRRGTEWRQDMPFEDIYGNGGLLTTVSDLLKWNRNIAGGKLHPTIFQLMQKPGSLSNGQPIGYGFGLFLQDFQGLAEVSHSGATAGYRAWLGRIPAKGISVAVLCNAGSADAGGYAHQILRSYLSLPKPEPPAPPGNVEPGLYASTRDRSTLQVDNANGRFTFDGTPVTSKVRFDDGRMLIYDPTYGDDIFERVEPWTPTKLSEFTGAFTSEEAETTLNIVVEDGKLEIKRRPNASFELQPTYADAFKCDLGSVRFLRDAAGTVTSMSLGGSRVWDLRFKRASTARNLAGREHS